MEGGEPAVPGQFPSTVYFKPKNMGNCTGTVIGQFTILLAAHCLVSDEMVFDGKKQNLRHKKVYIGDLVEISAGTNINNFRNYDRHITSISIHPSWTKRAAELLKEQDLNRGSMPLIDAEGPDVAIVTVDRPLNLPIAELDFTPQRRYQPVVIAGFGRLGLESGNWDKQLNHATVSIETFRTEFCSVGPVTVGTNALAKLLPGDSGGAVYNAATNKIVGVTSFGNFVKGNAWIQRLDTVRDWLEPLISQ